MAGSQALTVLTRCLIWRARQVAKEGLVEKALPAQKTLDGLSAASASYAPTAQPKKAMWAGAPATVHASTAVQVV